MTHPWSDLKWWNSGERQVVEEKIDDLQAKGVVCNPAKSLIYKALSATKEQDVRVVIVGQDPYPFGAFATGVAFSVPREIQSSNWPQTLRILLGEYQSDLGYDLPDHGELSRWTSQGCLLWNAIPSVQSGKPLSNDWNEWGYLTGEIIDRLSARGCVFAFLGGVAARYAPRVDIVKNRVIMTSHPSPRGNKFGKSPFTGSRIFSTINARLNEIIREPIDWCLTEEFSHGNIGQGYIPPPELGGGNVLQNVTGADLGRPPRFRVPHRVMSTFEV